MIQLVGPSITGDDIDRVCRTMLDGWVSTAGPVVEDFERSLGVAVGLPHVVATNSGTAALQLALSGLGVGQGDDVLISDFSFIAPANVVRLSGAMPRFIDSREVDWQLDGRSLAELLGEYEPQADRARHRQSGRRLGAVIVVHILGSLADLPLIRRLTHEVGVPLIEDAAQAMGARWDHLPFGATRFGESGVRVVCTSFNGNKLVTTGAGGAAMTDQLEIADRMRHLASVARVPDKWDYRHDEVGFNVRMNSLSAALGVSQLERLSGLVARSRGIAAHLIEAVEGTGRVIAIGEPQAVTATYWNLGIRLQEDSRAAAQRCFLAGIETRRPWMPVRRQAHIGTDQELKPSISDLLWQQGLLVPCRPTLTDSDVEFLATVLPRLLVP